MSFKKVFYRKISAIFNEFQQHAQCVKNQYGEPRSLKTVLRTTHAYVQLNFAEDYKCFTQDEAQPASWNFVLVTIHATVTYFKQNNSLVQQGERFWRLCLRCQQKSLPWQSAGN